MILIVCAFPIAPVALVWGWISWLRLPKMKTASSVFSLIGFILATCSAVLAIGSSIYAQRIGRFGFYDPLHLRIIRWGSVVSAVGILFGLAGVWRKNPLRWFSVASAVGTLALWILVAEAE
jgi:hypothetical protein